MRILIVDDDPLVRRSAGRILRAHGHQVTLAESGLDALVAITAESFDLVVTDMAMPGMNGNELGEALKNLGYPARRLVMSSEQEEDVRMDLFAGRLAKPITANQLLAFVQG